MSWVPKGAGTAVCMSQEALRLPCRRLMNVAALMCASLLDLFRITLKRGFAIASLPDTHFLNDGNRLLLFMGARTLRCTPAVLRLHVCLQEEKRTHTPQHTPMCGACYGVACLSRACMHETVWQAGWEDPSSIHVAQVEPTRHRPRSSPLLLSDGGRRAHAGCITSAAALAISCFLRERVQLVDSLQQHAPQEGDAHVGRHRGCAGRRGRRRS